MQDHSFHCEFLQLRRALLIPDQPEPGPQLAPAAQAPQRPVIAGLADGEIPGSQLSGEGPDRGQELVRLRRNALRARSRIQTDIQGKAGVADKAADAAALPFAQIIAEGAAGEGRFFRETATTGSGVSSRLSGQLRMTESSPASRV